MTAFLVLEDGTFFKGLAFGAPAPRPTDLQSCTADSKGVGEVLFNTAMSGYHETLTDPSYTGQILVMTYPHIGNYGCDDDWSEQGPEDRELCRVKAMGLVVREVYRGPVPGGRLTLDAFLKKWQTPGISGIDTRALTLRLRDKGSCNGVIVCADELDSTDLEVITAFLSRIPPMEGRNLITGVGTTQTEVLPAAGPLSFAVVDCGVKGAILTELEKRGVQVHLVPQTTSAREIMELNVHGVLFSNGPGDPAVLESLVATIRELIGKLPVYGICLGHQLIAQALGARTVKMKFGHHGVNHPVRDQLTKKVQVTSQNHGFMVDTASLPADVKPWLVNANDGSLEGLYHQKHQLMCCQFHPEAAPGPHDSSWIFDAFIKNAQGIKDA